MTSPDPLWVRMVMDVADQLWQAGNKRASSDLHEALRRAGDREAQVRAEERHRIAWWLRAGADGPFGESHSAEGAAAAARAMRSIADVIEQHPERFAEAPTGAVRRRG